MRRMGKVAIPKISHDKASKSRGRTSRACEPCRARKHKCGAETPACENCIQLDLDCHYTPLKRIRDQGHLYTLSKKVERYEQLLNDLLPEVGQPSADRIREALSAPVPLTSTEIDEYALNAASSSSAVPERLLESSSHEATPTTSEQSESKSPNSRPSEEDSAQGIQYNDKESAISVGDTSNASAVSKPRPEEVKAEGSNLLALVDLPPAEAIRVGALAFFRNTSALFYVMTSDQLGALIERTHDSPSTRDLVSVCEICALALVGIQYLPETSPPQVKQNLLSVAMTHLARCIEIDHIRGLRIFVCLAGYYIIEHKNTAHTFVASGLDLARSKLGSCQTLASDLPTLFSLYRTLIFMECWLSTSLGYLPRLGNAETQFIRDTKMIDLNLETELDFQRKAGDIALLKSDILKDSYGPAPVADVVELYMEKLEAWYFSLPPEMRIASLLSTDRPSALPVFQQRGLLFVHIVYLGAVILLHRRALAILSIERVRGASDPGGLSQNLTYYNTAVTAALHISRIFQAVDYEKNIFRRCWLCIYEIYSATTVLLFAASYQIWNRTDRGSTDEYLAHADSLIHMLTAAASADHVAKKLSDMLHPLRHEVHGLYAVVSGLEPGSPSPLWLFARFRLTMHTATQLLLHVFGEEQKSNLQCPQELDGGVATWWG